MSSRADEGLLVSVLIYWVAVLAGLALFVAPALWAHGPTIRQNIDPGNVRELLALRHGDGRFPVARLERQQPDGRTHIVELNARGTTQNSHRRPDRARHAQSRRAAERVRLARKVRHAQIARSYAAPAQRQRHRFSGALSAQY